MPKRLINLIVRPDPSDMMMYCEPWDKKEYDELIEGLRKLSEGKSFTFEVELKVKVETQPEEIKT